MTREEFKVGDKIHLMERELYNLKIKIIKSKKIPEPLREELANDVFEIEKQVKKNSVLDDVSERYTIQDIERCIENWGLCKVEKEYIERFLNGC